MRRAALVTVLALAGCSGGLRATGSVGDRPLDLDGTGAAWIDQTEYVVGSSTLQLQDRPPAQVTLHLLFSGAVFDPSRRLDEGGALARAVVEEDIARSDRLELLVRRGDRLAAGDVLDIDTDDFDIPQASPFVDRVRLSLGADPQGDDAAYPSEVGLVAARRVGTLEITEVRPSLLGVVRFAIEPAASQEGSERVRGEVEVGFDLELIPEPIAECNFARGDQGVLDPCTLGETISPSQLP
jgi:hypothetical protein